MTDSRNAGDPAPPARRPIRSALTLSLDLIGGRSRRRYWLVVCAQMATSLLDLAGVILVGITVVFAYSVPAGVPMPASIASAVDRLGLQDVPPESLALGCGALAATLLLLKSGLNAVLLRRIFRFLAARQVQLSARLSRRWFSADVHAVHARSDIEVEQALTQAVYYATTGLLGATAVVLSEVSLLVLLTAALLVVDPVATVLAAICFVLVSLVVHRVLSGWSGRVGRDLSQASVSARGEIRQSMESFRELRTSRRVGFPLARFESGVALSARAYADAMFINNVPKVAYEAALVGGALVLVAWQVGTGDVASALALLAVFLTAAARLLPSMVRLQGQLAMMGNAAGQAVLAYDVADLERDRPPVVNLDELGRAVPPSPASYDGFSASVSLEDVTVTYPGNGQETLVDVSLYVGPGESLVLVGSTGAGKSTLADVILGFTLPITGGVLVGGEPPEAALSRWPGAVAYMPQNCLMWGSTVRDNVALGLPRDAIDDDAVWRALEQAHVALEVRDRGGLDYQVGPAGRSLSGGQRQRLGIARALYSQPRLLVLDEATSALDEETEALIGSVLDELRGDVTVIAVAHRRATIERAGTVALLDGGRIAFLGSPTEYLAARSGPELGPTLDVHHAG